MCLIGFAFGMSVIVTFRSPSGDRIRPDSDFSMCEDHELEFRCGTVPRIGPMPGRSRPSVSAPARDPRVLDDQQPAVAGNEGRASRAEVSREGGADETAEGGHGRVRSNVLSPHERSREFPGPLDGIRRGSPWTA